MNHILRKFISVSGKIALAVTIAYTTVEQINLFVP